jgi:hypothetical protein
VIAKPRITLVAPNKTSMSTTTASFNVKAKVDNVKSRNEITVKVNNSSKTFAYSTSSKIMSLSVPLKVGKNVIHINAGNAGGQAASTITITRTARAVVAPKPTLVMTAPKQAASTTTNGTYAIKATIKNVKSKSGIIVKVNGAVKPFSYNTSSGAFVANTPLKVGKNTIVITAGTGANKVTKSITITRNAATRPPTNNGVKQNGQTGRGG